MTNRKIYLRIGDAVRTTDRADANEFFASLPDHTARPKAPKQGPRIALLTPYNGDNLGDAAIQDAVIANLRLRLPGAEFSGICMNCDNFVERHGAKAAPLCGPGRKFYTMFGGKYGRGAAYLYRGPYGPQGTSSPTGLKGALKRALKKVPVLGTCLKMMRACWQEVYHWIQGYCFLRKQDLLIVSGGGQLNEEWGGPWGQPFALFKWALLARMAGIPYVIASVGTGKVTSRKARLFLSGALRLSRYRSYRDKNTRKFAAGILAVAAKDSVVPDMAFSLPPSKLPGSAGTHAIAGARPIIAISPIVYARPRSWPYENRALYNRYLEQMGKVVSVLLKRDYFLVMVCSSLGDDESVIPELLERVDEELKPRFALQMRIPTINSWQDLVALLQDVDFLIASRLHSTILGFTSQTPAVAISFDPKVSWMMADLGLTDYLLHISDFTAKGVIDTLDTLIFRRKAAVEQIASYRHGILPDLAMQYDALAELAKVGRQGRN